MEKNNFEATGNLTKDAVLRFTGTGTPCLTFTVAVNKTYTDKAGQKQQKTSFIPLTWYVESKQSEQLKEQLKKGVPVLFDATVESWHDEKQNRYGFNFNVKGLVFIKRVRFTSDTQMSADNSSEANSDDWMSDYDKNSDQYPVK